MGNGESRGKRGPQLAGLTCGARAEGQAGHAAGEEGLDPDHSCLDSRATFPCWEPSRVGLGAHKAEGPGGGPAFPLKKQQVSASQEASLFCGLI